MGNKKEKNRFYFNKEFLSSPEGRSVRILSEYYGPLKNIKKNKIFDTIVFFGSARIKSKKEAKTIFDSLSRSATQQEINRAKKDVEMSRYYEDARRLA